MAPWWPKIRSPARTWPGVNFVKTSRDVRWGFGTGCAAGGVTGGAAGIVVGEGWRLVHPADGLIGEVGVGLAAGHVFGFVFGLSVGVVAALVFGLTLGLMVGLDFGRLTFLILIYGFGLGFGLVFGGERVIGGVSRTPITRPRCLRQIRSGVGCGR